MQIPLHAKLVRTIDEAPTSVACAETAFGAEGEKASALQAAGVEILGFPAQGTEIRLESLLRLLVARYGTSTILVEAGPGLLGRLFAARLVNEAWVFVGPKILGDERTVPAVRGLDAPRLSDARGLELIAVHRRGPDVLMRYRAATPSCRS